jgi:hypothetical protein
VIGAAPTVQGRLVAQQVAVLLMFGLGSVRRGGELALAATQFLSQPSLLCGVLSFAAPLLGQSRLA